MARMLQVHTVQRAPHRAALAPFLALLAVGLTAACGPLGPLRGPREPEASFDPNRPAELDARTVIGADGAGLTLVRPRVEGRDLGWFLLDSGSANLLVSTRDARALDLPVVAEGFADRRLPVTYHRAREVRLGPLTLRDSLVAAVDWSHAEPLRKALATELAGLAGYQVFAHAVVEIRYGSGPASDRVLLHDPATYDLPTGVWHTLRVVDRRPVVAARLTLPDSADEAPREVDLIVDTGTAGALALDPELARRAGLLPSPPEPREPAGRERLQLAARVRSLGVDAPTLELAGVRFEQVPLALRPTPLGTRRALAGIGGLVGRQLLQGRTLVLDYTHRRVAVLP